MSRRRSGISAASIIVFTLTVVLLAATATYFSVATVLSVQAGNRAGSEAQVRGKYGLRASLLGGLPPGVSPKAWLVIHQEYGVGDTIRDIIIDGPGGILHRRLEEGLREGGCRAIRLERLGLPRSVREYNATIVIHMESGAVGRAYQRVLEPDAIYPCGIDPPVRPGMFTVNIRVVYEKDGNRHHCGACRDAVAPEPGQHMTQAYTVISLAARNSITVSGETYFFSHWEVRFSEPPGDLTVFTLNPLLLFADDNYHVDAVYIKSGQ